MIDSPQTKKWLDQLQSAGLFVPAGVIERAAQDLPDQTLEAFVDRLREWGSLTAWQAEELKKGRKNFLIGKYRLLQKLGQGGMGEVFLAQHATMERRVAIKVIARDLPAEALQRFLLEVRTIAVLDHPNIVHAYNVDVENDRYYLVMEYVEGADLEQLIQRQGPLAWQKAVDIIRQTAAGLGHAHEQGIVHRDIKPANLMVTPQGLVKILDLGLARLQGSKSASDSGPSRILGSVDYMAPEVALDPESADPRSDIYSLGCVLFFLLTGKPPFAGGTLSERIVKHQKAPPPDVRALRPEVPARLSAIIQKMLAKAPAHRFQSTDELITELRQCEEAPAKVLVRAKAIAEENETTDTARVEKETASIVPVQTGNFPARKKTSRDQRSTQAGVTDLAAGQKKNSLVAQILFLSRQRPWLLGFGAAALMVALIAGGIFLFRGLSQRPDTTPQSQKSETAAHEPPITQKTVRPEDDPEEFRRQIEQWMRKQMVSPQQKEQSSDAQNAGG